MSRSRQRGLRAPGKDRAADGLWIVVPVKPLALSKQRLKACLGPVRPGLTRAMLHDVLAALESSAAVQGVVVVTMDNEAAALAASGGACVVEEAGPYGMNRAIEQGLAAARQLGAARLGVVPLDIPLLTGGEVDRLFREWRSRAAESPEPVLGIVPSGDGDGTNWVCFGADVLFVPSYGPGSYRRHLEAARAQGQQPIGLTSPRVSLDIDEAADLEAFLAYCEHHTGFQATRTWRFLRGQKAKNAGYTPVRPRESGESNHAIGKS